MLLLRRPLRALAAQRHYRCYSSIDVANLRIEHTKTLKPRVAKEKLQFGVTTTDHILEVDWDIENVSDAVRCTMRSMNGEFLIVDMVGGAPTPP